MWKHLVVKQSQSVLALCEEPCKLQQGHCTIHSGQHGGQSGILCSPQWSTWGPVRETVQSTVVNKGAVRDSVQYTVVNMGGNTCTLSEWLLGREIR